MQLKAMRLAVQSLNREFHNGFATNMQLKAGLALNFNLMLTTFRSTTPKQVVNPVGSDSYGCLIEHRAGDCRQAKGIIA